MKIRSDFITNSSSSSFIVAFTDKVNIPENFLSYFHQMFTIDDAIEALDQNCESDQIFNNIDENFIKAMYQLTDKQLGLLKAAYIDKIEEYDKIVTLLTTKIPVFHVVADWDSKLFKLLNQILKNQNIIEEVTL